jgi:hypothetical protein
VGNGALPGALASTTMGADDELVVSAGGGDDED